jgi:hypothetical protein
VPCVVQVYHDIGLWTHSALSYVDPSADLAAKDLKGRFSPVELARIRDIILWHHKLTPFGGDAVRGNRHLH